MNQDSAAASARPAASYSAARASRRAAAAAYPRPMSSNLRMRVAAAANSAMPSGPQGAP
jgi:hypothetical protein